VWDILIILVRYKGTEPDMGYDIKNTRLEYERKLHVLLALTKVQAS
jgi:hypothetical protein